MIFANNPLDILASGHVYSLGDFGHRGVGDVL